MRVPNTTSVNLLKQMQTIRGRIVFERRMRSIRAAMERSDEALSQLDASIAKLRQPINEEAV